MSAIHKCIEEEYSLAPSWLWRHSQGWKPLFMYFRGPAGIPFFIAPFLTLLGIWRFSRKPQRLSDIPATSIVGGRILRVSDHLGSYGMGGPGFVGFKIRDSGARVFWLVVAVWGASEWLTIDGSPCREGYFASERMDLEKTLGSPLSSLSELVGFVITSVDAQSRQFLVDLTNGTTQRRLRLEADSSFLPAFRGSNESRIMPDSDDIRDAILISRRGNLWL